MKLHKPENEMTKFVFNSNDDDDYYDNNNDSCCLLSIYYLPDTGLSISHVQSH